MDIMDINFMCNFYVKGIYGILIVFETISEKIYSACISKHSNVMFWSNCTPGVHNENN